MSISFMLAVAPVFVPVHAADDGAPLETIVVTASRIPLPLAQAGSSVTVIDREQIDRRQAVFVTDLLQEVPGVAISRSGGIGSQAQVRVRGAEANQVLVMVDGVRANDPAGNDEFPFQDLATWDVDRVEVVRGPQSALWGSDAIAGVVNVITRPTSDRLQAQAWAEGGSFGTIAGGAQVSDAAGGVGYSVGLARLASDGTNNSRTGGERDGYGNTTASLRLSARPTDDLELGATARYTDAHKDYDAVDFATGLPADSSDHSDTAFGYYQVRGTLGLLDDRWTQSLRGSLVTSDAHNANALGGTGATSTDTWGVHYQTTYRPADGTAVAGATALTLAVDREWQEFHQRGPVYDYGPGAVYDPNQDQSMDTTSVAAEVNLSPWRQTYVSLGARYDDSDAYRSVLTYRGTVSWTAESTRTALHASYGTGQKAPTFTERYGYYPGQFVGNPDLDPEQSRGWEIGLLQPLHGDRYSVGVTYFDEDLTDEIDGFVYDPASGLYTARNLPGTSQRHGVEATASARLADALTVTAAYTYTHSTQPDAATGKDVPEIRRPENVASLNADWSFLAGRAGLNLNVAYNGSQTDTFYEVTPPYGTRTVRLDAYTLVSLAVRYDVSRSVRLYARGENLLDEDYENVYGYATPGIGVMAGLQVSY
ncbi:MAG: TonB-dependent receptor [Steroidobacteraceae bacterium]